MKRFRPLPLGERYTSSVHFVARTPSPALRPFVASFWLYEGAHAHALERVLPHGELQLLVNLEEDALRCRRGGAWERESRIGGIGLVGLRDAPAAIDTAQQRRIAGVAFRPGGAWAFFEPPLIELRNLEVDLADLWGREARAIRDAMLEAPSDDDVLRILERALHGRWCGERPDRGLDAAVCALVSGARVDATADALGTTPATLRRRFLRRVGASPKRFARVARVGRALRALDRGAPESWARFAFEQGFVDQSHLIRELKDLCGITPSEYLPRTPAETFHVVID